MSRSTDLKIKIYYLTLNNQIRLSLIQKKNRSIWDNLNLIKFTDDRAYEHPIPKSSSFGWPKNFLAWLILTKI